jgi:hypothetical protein
MNVNKRGVIAAFKSSVYVEMPEMHWKNNAANRDRTHEIKHERFGAIKRNRTRILFTYVNKPI